MPIPTEPIGSIPRPKELVDALTKGETSTQMEPLFESAVRDTLAQFAATGSPIITDGEQRKVMSFASYSIEGADNIAPDGVAIPFADGHTRVLPRLLRGPFRYLRHAGDFLNKAKGHTELPLKQSVISASALSLLYPVDEIPGYSRDAFVADLVRENEIDIRSCFQEGARSIQIDFTEGRLAIKLDPSKNLLRTFVDFNNQVLSRFSQDELKLIGVHTCPGSDRTITHSADVDYAELLPHLFEMQAGNFYVQLASEPDHASVLRIIKKHLPARARVFVGVIDPSSARVETPEEVRDRVLEAAEYIPLDQLGTTDDCGFSPFADDQSRTRETAFAKIRARVEGTALAAQKLGV